MVETVLDLDLSNIQGIGPRKREKLIDGGIESVLDLAAALPGDVEEVLGGSREGASRMLLSARIFLEKSGLLDKEFMPEVQFVQVEERTPFNLNTVRNLGIQAATNDIIIIFDADCIPQQTCIDNLRRNAERGVFLSGLVAYEVSYKKQLNSTLSSASGK